MVQSTQNRKPSSPFEGQRLKIMRIISLTKIPPTLAPFIKQPKDSQEQNQLPTKQPKIIKNRKMKSALLIYRKTDYNQT